MADAKISALPSATTPVAGTEVLPIVQSGATKQVSITNLTAGKQVNVGSLLATGGYSTVTITSTTGGTKTVNIGSDAYTNAFIGTTTAHNLSLVAGAGIVAVVGTDNNIAISNAAKGINFTANTPAAGMTSQLLSWYEEGTFTPAQGSGLTLVGAFSSQGRYTRVGRLVTLHGYVAGATSVAVSAGGQVFTGAPFAAGLSCAGSLAGYSGVGNSVCLITNGSTNMISNTAIAASTALFFTITYSV